MDGICLHVTATLASSRLNVSASLYCGLGANYIPLLVDEGYLIVELNGSDALLYVKK
jgi:hypothetical protein